LARSEVPRVAGRYSAALAAFTAWNLLLCGLAVWAWRRRSFRGGAAVYVLLILSSLLFPGNNVVRELPLLRLVLPLMRLWAAGCLGALAFRAATARGRPPRLTLALGTGFATLAVLDLLLVPWLGVFPRSTPVIPKTFREAYDLGAVTADDIVLVGDSF